MRMRWWSCMALALVGLLACDSTDGTESESESESESEGEGGATACPGATPALDGCFRGIAFADCGGDGEPIVGCGVEGSPFGGCLWFTGGCVAEGFETGSCVPGEVCDDSVTKSCGRLLFQRGEQPWDAERAMALALTIDEGFSASSTDISCTGCADNCSGENVCVGGADSKDDAASAWLRGTLAIGLVPAEGIFGGWVAEIEVNLDASIARLCRIASADESHECGDPYGEPACAISGSLTLSRLPLSDADLDGLSGSVSATFDDGLEMSGEFLVPAK